MSYKFGKKNVSGRKRMAKKDNEGNVLKDKKATLPESGVNVIDLKKNKRKQ